MIDQEGTTEDDVKWCNFGGSSSLNLQEKTFTAATQTRTFRNFKLVDYIYYARPGSPAWKRMRRNTAIFYAVILLLQLPLPWLIFFLDLSADGEVILEALSVCVVVVALFGFIGFSNLDILVLRIKTTLFIIDFISVTVASSMLFVFGEGFSIFGGIYFIGMISLAYAMEGVELNARLNTRNPNLTFFKVSKYVPYTAIFITLAMFRVLVFYKKITITPTVIIDDIPGGAGEFTLRDLWEFFVDVIIVRIIIITVNRFQQKSDQFSLGEAYAAMTDP